ncbi:AMP-binding protein [Streptomyces sp. XH2]|uniref:AMP-binding protein n=1 Tax=Streptomyces sp. XH2 TaxID=3412483 RepID=UPI003C7AC61F
MTPSSGRGGVPGARRGPGQGGRCRGCCRAARQRDGVQRDGVRPRDVAYALFTSGSTGTSRAVEIEHGSVVHLLAALERTVYAGQGREAAGRLHHVRDHV